MPVVGSNLILTPIWINTWKIINNIEPIKISLLQLFLSFLARDNPEIPRPITKIDLDLIDLNFIEVSS